MRIGTKLAGKKWLLVRRRVAFVGWKNFLPSNERLSRILSVVAWAIIVAGSVLLHRLRGYQFKRLLIVGTKAELLSGEYRSNIRPASVLGSLRAFEVRYDRPSFFELQALWRLLALRNGHSTTPEK